MKHPFFSLSFEGKHHMVTGSYNLIFLLDLPEKVMGLCAVQLSFPWFYRLEKGGDSEAEVRKTAM
jgi:hypothetical protein